MGSAVSHSNCHYVPLLNLPIGSVLFRRTAANARVLWAGPIGRSSHIVSECTARSDAASGKYQVAGCKLQTKQRDIAESSQTLRKTTWTLSLENCAGGGRDRT